MRFGVRGGMRNRMAPEAACVGFSCPVLQSVKLFERKWTLQIVDELAGSSRTFNGLKRQLPGITQSVLAARLKDLQRARFVKRRVLDRHPLGVEYSLDKTSAPLVRCWKEHDAIALKIKA